MKKKNRLEIIKHWDNWLIYLVVVSIILLLSNFFFWGKMISVPTAFVVDPIAFYANKMAISIKGVGDLVKDASDLNQKYLSLEDRYDALEANTSYVSVLMEENKALREQLKVSGDEWDLILAQVVADKNISGNDHVILNKGSKNGVEKGDIVVLGNVYVGVVTEVRDQSSKVRLPTSRASFLQVMFPTGLDKDFNPDEVTEDIKFGDAIANGSLSGITLENIVTQRDVKEGVVVLINDKEVGSYLLLGYIDKVASDPTASSKTATVEPGINYNEQKILFIRKSK